MNRIFQGVTRFQQEIFPEYRQLFELLANVQNPEALFITCSDSRVVPNLITQTQPGDLFICRNPGNIIPPWGEAEDGVTASLEYAVLCLEVQDIIVCGHSDCGAMKALLDLERLSGMPGMKAWLRYAEPAKFIIRENYLGISEQERLDRLVEENVLAQLQSLKTHPYIAARIKRGIINLHGWVYDIKTGLIRMYDPDQRRFIDFYEPARLSQPISA